MLRGFMSIHTVQSTPTNQSRSKFRLLKQTTSGQIYAWDENLAKRHDMVEWKHPTRVQGSKRAPQTPDEIKIEAASQSEAEVSQDDEEPSVAEMAKAVLGKGKKSAIAT